MTIGIGLYGVNGHQLHHTLGEHPRARIVAAAEFPDDRLSPEMRNDPELRIYSSLDEMLDDGRVQLVSLCSPRRREQWQDSIRCLEAGKHVFAEKPCAMTEKDLDALLDAASSAKTLFREMGGSGFYQPFLAMREIVLAGTIGTVVQVYAQKSYPYFDARPQDEDIDGGLLCQAGIHAFRFVETVACQKITSVRAIETRLGNPKEGDLKMAASYILRLENGGVASMLSNYLNPLEGFGMWGNDQLRIFGTEGFVEAVDGGTRTRLVVGSVDHGPIDTSAPSRDHFEMFLDEIEGIAPMPLSLEEELHSTRMVIRAKQSADEDTRYL